MKITPKELSALINAYIDGNPNVELTSFAKIEEAGKGDLSFIANPKYAHFIYSTKASAVLVRRDFVADGEVTPTLIRVDDPYATLAELLTIVENLKPKPVGIEQPSYISENVVVPDDAYIGAFSYIGKGVKLGNNVKIYPQVYVGDGCVIGNDTVIRPGVKIYEGCKIGERCILHSGVVIGADGFGFAPKDGRYEKIPQIGNVIISDDVEIGANTTIDRATFGSTVIGQGTKLDNLLQIGHNVTIGENNVFAAQTGIAGSTQIGDNNRIGGQCGFAGHIKVGNNNEIGAQSGIPNNVTDGNRLMGYPAVDFMQFAKQQVYLKRLENLFKKK